MEIENKPEFSEIEDSDSALSCPGEQDVYNAMEQDFRRENRKLRHEIFKWAVRIVSIVFACIFIVYCIHLVLPEKLRWLSPEDLMQLKSLAVSICVGVLASFTSGYFRK